MIATENPRRPLNRAEASAYLMERHGICRKTSTLARLACRGGGPAFRKAGSKFVVYERAELDRWAASIMSGPLASTSEFSARAA